MEYEIDTGLNNRTVRVDYTYNWNNQVSGTSSTSQTSTSSTSQTNTSSSPSVPDTEEDTPLLSTLLLILIVFFGSVYLIHYRNFGFMSYLKLYKDYKFGDVIKGNIDTEKADETIGQSVKTKYCISCGQENTVGNKYCRECGNEIQ